MRGHSSGPYLRGVTREPDCCFQEPIRDQLLFELVRGMLAGFLFGVRPTDLTTATVCWPSFDAAKVCLLLVAPQGSQNRL